MVLDMLTVRILRIWFSGPLAVTREHSLIELTRSLLCLRDLKQVHINIEWHYYLAAGWSDSDVLRISESWPKLTAFLLKSRQETPSDGLPDVARVAPLRGALPKPPTARHSWHRRARRRSRSSVCCTPSPSSPDPSARTRGCEVRKWFLSLPSPAISKSLLGWSSRGPCPISVQQVSQQEALDSTAHSICGNRRGSAGVEGFR
ncbi:hypothetical protein DAEQUDRAFT_729427 [Daedalea quercina L-15889]|uniref:Uncharacterized protein n=1 Tax=Daedalea quercina L-15889 TaxID=1314783 RepID=A0A165NNT0_9APHY|nr:hypothetical protein DAEQUDRAFT_729427 [Daedalea quercina L-15889]